MSRRPFVVLALPTNPCEDAVGRLAAGLPDGGPALQADMELLPVLGGLLTGLEDLQHLYGDGDPIDAGQDLGLRHLGQASPVEHAQVRSPAPPRRTRTISPLTVAYHASSVGR